MSVMNLQQAGTAEMVERFLMDTRKCLVAVVTELNEENELCVTVQPAVKRRVMMPTNREIGYAEMMPIVDVPVADIGGIRKIPLVGDHGIVIFHDVDFQKYLNTRELSDLASARFHDYSDAMFFPFEVAKVERPEPYAVIGCDTIYLNRDTSIDGGLRVSGDLQVVGDISAGGDVVAGTVSLQTLAVSFQTHIHPHPYGPTGPPSVTNVTGTPVEVLIEECPQPGGGVAP